MTKSVTVTYFVLSYRQPLLGGLTVPFVRSLLIRLHALAHRVKVAELALGKPITLSGLDHTILKRPDLDGRHPSHHRRYTHQHDDKSGDHRAKPWSNG